MGVEIQNIDDEANVKIAAGFSDAAAWYNKAMLMLVSALLCVLLSTMSMTAAQAGEFRDVTPDASLSFPGALYYNGDYRVQWWYFTGHLFDEAGREFGYELTFFAAGVQKRKYVSEFGVDNIYISHFALTDVAGKKYYFTDLADSGAFGFSGAESGKLLVHVGNNSLEGGMKSMHIMASGDTMHIDLWLVPVKPLVLNGDKGYSRKSEGSPLLASLYCSCPRMAATGTVAMGPALFKVKGYTWFDRELSTRGLGENLAGWDWFSVHLDDNREIMLYLLRKKDGTTDAFSSGTFVYPDGSYRHLPLNSFNVKVLKHYTSRSTGARYPARWSVAIPSEGLSITISPLVEDQEFVGRHSTSNYYWEGTASVTGSAKGRAYVELTGY